MIISTTTKNVALQLFSKVLPGLHCHKYDKSNLAFCIVLLIQRHAATDELLRSMKENETKTTMSCLIGLSLHSFGHRKVVFVFWVFTAGSKLNYCSAQSGWIPVTNAGTWIWLVLARHLILIKWYWCFYPHTSGGWVVSHMQNFVKLWSKIF